MVRRIHVYADGANLDSMRALSKSVRGITTNPTLMRQAGISDYRQFARDALKAANGLPVSLEVFADDFDGMERQAREIASFSPMAVVKIPVMNSLGQFCDRPIATLSSEGVPINVTAVMTSDQVRRIARSLQGPGAIVSIFAGRIADTGVDPEPIVADAVRVLRPCGARVLWASTREAFNIVQAERAGANIITMTPEQIAKLANFGRDLFDYSLETVKQFKRDAEGLTL